MYNKSIIHLKWKLSGRIDIFTTLSGLFKTYNADLIGISIHSLYRVDLYKGWENDTVIIRKIDVTKWFDAYFKLLQKK